jgi:hypothetical protein
MSEESMPSLRRLAVAVVVVRVATLALPASAGMRVVDTAPFAGPGRHPGPYAVDPVARKAFVGIHGASPALLVLDLDTLEVKSRIDLRIYAAGVAVDRARRRVVVGNAEPGACPAGTEPLYRLYNEGRGGAPNHRYTNSPQTFAAMTANGWSAEGTGPGRVFACTPVLR